MYAAPSAVLACVCYFLTTILKEIRLKLILVNDQLYFYSTFVHYAYGRAFALWVKTAVPSAAIPNLELAIV